MGSESVRARHRDRRRSKSGRCALIVLDASTDSEWAARCLEGLGHEVIVAGSNFAPMYETRSPQGEDRPAGCNALAEA
jgi:transposase